MRLMANSRCIFGTQPGNGTSDLRCTAENILVQKSVGRLQCLQGFFSLRGISHKKQNHQGEILHLPSQVKPTSRFPNVLENAVNEVCGGASWPTTEKGSRFQKALGPQ